MIEIVEHYNKHWSSKALHTCIPSIQEEGRTMNSSLVQSTKHLKKNHEYYFKTQDSG